MRPRGHKPGSNRKFCAQQNVTLFIAGEAVGDTAAKLPGIMALSAPDGNHRAMCRRLRTDKENLQVAPLVGAAMCWSVGAIFRPLAIMPSAD